MWCECLTFGYVKAQNESKEADRFHCVRHEKYKGFVAVRERGEGTSKYSTVLPVLNVRAILEQVQ